MAGKKWTEKELYYLDTNWGVNRKDVIKRDIPNRSWNAIKNMAKQRGLSVSNRREGIKISECCARTGISRTALSRAVRTKKCKKIRVALDRCVELDPVDIREYALKYRAGKIHTCWECGTKVRGDIWCSRHLPVDLHLKNRKTEWRVWCGADDVEKKLGGVLKEVREEHDISQYEVSKSLHYSKSNIANIEAGRVKRLYLDRFVDLAKAMGLDVEIHIKKVHDPKIERVK